MKKTKLDIVSQKLLTCLVGNAVFDNQEKWAQFLTDRQAEVIRLRFGFDGYERTLDEVAAVLHVTRERVRQIEAIALRRMRWRIREVLGLGPAKVTVHVHHVHEPVQDRMEPDMPLEALPLSVRSRNCLHNAGLKTVNDLITMTPRDVLGIQWLGKKCCDEIEGVLKDLGLALKGEPIQAVHEVNQ